MQWLLSLPVPLLFVVTMTCRLFVETSNRNYSKKYSDNQLGFLFFNGVSGVVCALVLFIASFSLDVSLFTICTGLAYGVITMMSTMHRPPTERRPSPADQRAQREHIAGRT